MEDHACYLHVFQLREYVLQDNGNTSNNKFKEQSDPVTTGNKDLADQDDIFAKTSEKAAESKLSEKFKYNVSDKTNMKAEDIVEFIPLHTKGKEKNQQSEIISNVIPLQETKGNYRNKKKKVTLFGAKPAKGFRSFSSRTGYHASTSPENFLKKKYESEHLRKAQRKVFSGMLDSVPKSELYQHIMAQYGKGGVGQRRKKKLRTRKHRRHRSMSLWKDFDLTAYYFRASKLWGICLECMGPLQ